MEREIKFRAWHKELKNYYYFDLYDVFCAGEYKGSTQNLQRPMTCFNINHKPFEQYTGLKDAGGIPIYENDIVAYFEALGYEKDSTAQVAWDCDSAAFYVENDKDEVFESIYDVMGYCRVVGNIHENPELL